MQFTRKECEMNNSIPTNTHHRLGTRLAIVASAAFAVTLLMVGCQQGLNKTTRIPFSHPADGSPASAEPLRRSFEASGDSLPALDEEVWVVARPRIAPTAPRDDVPGSGSLWTRVEEEEVA